MNNTGLEQQIQQEIIAMVNQQQSLMLATLDADNLPYASYAPYAVGEHCLYVLISEIALHAQNLQLHPKASVLIIEDEASAEQLFARRRISYQVDAVLLPYEQGGWQTGIDALTLRHGERITQLSQFADFKLFQLNPSQGRYIKGFGKAYQIDGGTLAGESLSHLRGGHKKRQP
jgi:putative heme iron utilization protein